MTLFIALLLTVITFAFIAYPLFRRRSVSLESMDDEKYRELSSRSNTTHSILKDAEGLEKDSVVDEEIEKQVQALRHGKSRENVSVEQTEEVRQRFLIRLAYLDDDFESGTIAEREYKKLRAEVKIHLVELLQKAKDDKGGR